MMKAKILILITLLAMTACSQSETIEIPQESQSKDLGLPQRSVTDAIEIACNAKNIKNDRGRASMGISVKAITNHLSRSSEVDTLMYVVEFEDDGFVLVSKPTTVEPIIALIDEGSFDSPGTRSNESFQSILENAKAYVAATDGLAKAAIKPIDPIPTFYYDTTYINNKVAPRIKVSWNQYWPENIYCPNKVAGCGPIAIAQILSYFELPKTLSLTFEGADKSSLSIDWTQIKKHVKSLNIKEPTDATITNHLAGCTTLEYHKDLGRIVRQMGQLAKSDYYSKPNTTSTPLQGIYTTLMTLLNGKTFTKSEADVTDLSPLYNLISQSGVASLYGVRTTSTNTHAAHIWVVDGSWQIGTIIKYYSMSDQVTEPGYQLVSTTTKTQEYLHLNWGWGGNSNGYFLLGIFDTTKPYRYDNFTGNTASYNYNDHFEYMHIK